jgi:hypothetical protein
MITEEYLLATGWRKEVFFYATVGGEDEDDCDIFVKGNLALTYDYDYEAWWLADYDDLNYSDGFPCDKRVTCITDFP